MVLRALIVLLPHVKSSVNLASGLSGPQGVANDPETARAMALFWGVTAVPRPDVANRDELRAIILDWCHQKGLITPGDRIVGIRGSWSDDPTHNEIVVLEVPRSAV